MKELYHLSTGTTGALNELVAAADLMRRGYHVFRALSPSCPCDLLIFGKGQTLRVEVRTATVLASRKLSFNLKSTDEGKFEVLALVIESRKVVYLPALDEGRLDDGHIIATDVLTTLRLWGVLPARQMEGFWGPSGA